VDASPGVFNSPSQFFEFNGTNLISVPAAAGASSVPSYIGRMLVLPTGQILLTGLSSVQVYTASGTYQSAWQPTVTSVPANLSVGSVSNVISGTQFNGLSQGAAYGDDAQSATNYPLVRITNNTTGHVFYARTHDHSTMAVATGSATVSTKFDIPSGIETGASTLQVVANGIPSNGVPVQIIVENAPLFFDDFNRTTGLGSNWSVLEGSYTTDGANAVSGAMTPSGTGNWAQLTAALPNSNYSVAADIIVPSGSVDSGLVARSKDTSAFSMTLYAAQIWTDGNIYLYRRNDWNWTLLDSTAGGIVANTSYNLKLIVTGSNPVHLEVWLNGVQTIVYNDSSIDQIATGTPGLENYYPGVKYDNFTIRQQ